jgi:alpha-beta hydrolase superfamily lysophospholipase
MARALRVVAPRMSLASNLPAEGLSRDPAVISRYLEDPLIGARATVSLGAEMLGAVRRTAAGGAAIGVPMLLLHGGEDPLCPPEGSEAFFASLGPYREASALRIYPGLRHEIFNEPEQCEIFSEVLTWMRAREEDAARGPGVAALAQAGARG